LQHSIDFSLPSPCRRRCHHQHQHWHRHRWHQRCISVGVIVISGGGGGSVVIVLLSSLSLLSLLNADGEKTMRDDPLMQQ
jgi:hypothetical protein